MPTQLHVVSPPTQKYVYKHKKLRVKIANSYIRMMYIFVSNGELQNRFLWGVPTVVFLFKLIKKSIWINVSPSTRPIFLQEIFLSG
jgi:hypothetical protein